MASHLQRPPRGLDDPSQVRETFLKVGGRDTSAAAFYILLGEGLSPSWDGPCSPLGSRAPGT